jgi:hypothetical protein
LPVHHSIIPTPQNVKDQPAAKHNGRAKNCFSKRGNLPSMPGIPASDIFRHVFNRKFLPPLQKYARKREQTRI